MPFFTDSPSHSSQKKVAKGYWKHRIACKTGFSRHPVLSGFRFVIVGLNFHAFSYFFYKEFSNTLSCVKKKWLFPFQKLSKISLSSFPVDHWSNLEFSCSSFSYGSDTMQHLEQKLQQHLAFGMHEVSIGRT